MLPYSLMLQTKSFILRVQSFRIKQKEIELATEKIVPRNKAGEKGTTRSTLSIRCTAKRDVVPTLPSP